jgi:hypothetical protein
LVAAAPLSLPLLLLGVVLAGCSGLPVGTGPETTSSVGGRAPTFRERVTNLFSVSPNPSGNVQQAATPRRDAADECPGVEIRPGASTLQYSAPGSDPSPVNLRYQTSIARTARECAISGGTMSMKVGIQGRLILGPAGGPGEVDVPLRYAVVQEGVEPKTIWTNLRRFPVSVPPNQTQLSFVDVEETIQFPLPSRNDLAAYVVYVGFDQVAAQEKPGKRRRRSR